MVSSSPHIPHEDSVSHQVAATREPETASLGVENRENNGDAENTETVVVDIDEGYEVPLEGNTSMIAPTPAPSGEHIVKAFERKSSSCFSDVPHCYPLDTRELSLTRFVASQLQTSKESCISRWTLD